MRFGLTKVAPLVLVAVGVATAAAACSSSDRRSGFDAPKDDAGVEAGPAFVQGDAPCVGLECKREKCDDGSTTTLTGKVYDPAGVNALYNVLVYIPGGTNGDDELPAIPEGVSCETCASVAVNPLVSALTDTQGAFTLENVPVDKDVPVVIQIGKWRRRLTIDIPKKCEENKVPKGDFRLPRNGSEGDMPHIAVTAGGCDALECLLRGIGVDDEEFVPGHSTDGHVHVFNGQGGNFPGAPKAGGDTANPLGGELWNDSAQLAKYDMVMLSCECGENNGNKGGETGHELTGARQAMWDYANMGGRIFATHFHSTWFKNSPQVDFQMVANWNTVASSSNSTYDVVESMADGSAFPKGAALADWLVGVKASKTRGKITLEDVTSSLSSVNAPAQGWIRQGENNVKYFSFNTPTNAPVEEQCGRAVYSDLHLMGISAGGQEFPTGCPASGGLSAQQKALEFMFFDLSGCVQDDKTPPSVPK
ncbi:Tryptophan synthase alpha chain [Labilithrix luteola]|uniref:Tryptophan synthase alpha chain n=1 Tax=Labilithrix luteola TaxID=1391654 RepID=A0A0K1QEJ7_9BACT|nr:carboxypeptidase regulatory-like domain-containing protein [Labilithrix luteola]AKV04092.1 Tryptophan synthase alpha chain [Labilithrix luteola]